MRSLPGIALLVAVLRGAGPAWASGGWSVVPSPNPIVATSNYLKGVTALSATDVWAVGSYFTSSSCCTQQTLIEHFNGTNWRVVPSPTVGTSYNYLAGVTAVSATDVWAVGAYYTSGTLIEHYDGTGWHVVPSPNTGGTFAGVTALSATDVWAVGAYVGNSGSQQTLTEHYDGTSWSVVPSPNAGTNGSFLTGVAATSASDIWAVGYYNLSSGTQQTLTEHYNGTSWSVVPSPNPGANGDQFLGVTALSATDVWAVGNYCCSSTGAQQTLIEHFNGTSWSVVPSPNVGTGGNSLAGVTALSATDVWAVGFSGFQQTLIEHYDGTSWSVVPSPNVGTGGTLAGVTALSATDVWAVGNYGSTSGFQQSLIDHYNGTNWSVVPSRNVGTNNSVLSGMTALSASDVWAVGYTHTSPGQNQRTLIEHYNGTSWSVVPSPNPGANGDQFLGVTALSATDVWAVGNYCCSSTGAQQTLIEHFNGTNWRVVPSPNVGTGGNSLAGVTTVSATDVWAVGYSSSYPSPSQTLIEHYDGTSWSVVPSPNVAGYYNVLSGVTALSATDVWAVGNYCCSNTSPSQTLIEHYDGTSWRVVPSPNVGTGGNSLAGVTALSATDVWAVGDSYNGTHHTLIEHYGGSSWRVVPSPSGSLFGVTATSATDVWAVGVYYTSSGVERTLIDHYNGTSWSVVPSPNVGTDDILYGVMATASDVWAVGFYISSSGATKTLIEHCC